MCVYNTYIRRTKSIFPYLLDIRGDPFTIKKGLFGNETEAQSDETGEELPKELYIN